MRTMRQDKWSDSFLSPTMTTDLVSGSCLIPSPVLFYSFSVPNAISCGREARNSFLPTPCPCCLHLILNCFLPASMLKLFSSLPSSDCRGTIQGRKEWGLLCSHWPFGKIISTLISQIFGGKRKTEMWDRKSLLFVLVFDNVCNLSGWFKRFRYFL